MRTDTLQASLETSLLRGEASAHHIIKVLNKARRQQRRQEREARGKVISVRKLSRTYERKERFKGREEPAHLRGIVNKSRGHVALVGARHSAALLLIVCLVLAQGDAAVFIQQVLP